MNLKTKINLYERELILKGLVGAKTTEEAAKTLGVNRTTLIAKLKKQNIQWKFCQCEPCLELNKVYLD